VSSPVWYLRRLSAMTPSEVMTRARHAGVKLAWRRQRVDVGQSDDLELPPGTRTFRCGLDPAALGGVDAQARAALLERADSILAGHFDALGITYRMNPSPDWSLDPVSGTRAPADYSFSIPIRDPERTGDVKLLWELSRHHHLTVLAAAYALTGDERYAQRAADDLGNWIDENPWLTGVQWTSGIELGIRLISWVWTRRLLDGWDGVAASFEGNPDFVRQVRRHQQWLNALHSRGSSANNHVVAEAAGLLISATAFAWFDESAALRKSATELLQRECDAQTFPGGLNRELATEYHGLVLELALLSILELATNDHPVPAMLRERTTAMADALAHILDAGGAPPRQGDGDDGQVLLVDGADYNRWISVLDTAGMVFGTPAWWPKFTEPSVRASVLAALAVVPDSLAVPDRPRPDLAEAGMALIRSRHPDLGEIYCRFDVAEHGFLSIAAHAHADALSVEVRVDGVPLLVDPGTFAYHGAPGWRTYTRSTIGHNTVEVDGRDQSVSTGPFMWSRTAETTIEALTEDDSGQVTSVVASHDGYSRLDPPVVHRRTVTLESPSAIFVRDQMDGLGERQIRAAFHLGPSIDVELDAAVATVRWVDPAGAARTATLRLDPALRWQHHRGELDPILGWYAPRYGERVETSTLIGRGTAAHLETELRFE
jgi:hypothetical protein